MILIQLYHLQLTKQDSLTKHWVYMVKSYLGVVIIKLRRKM